MRSTVRSLVVAAAVALPGLVGITSAVAIAASTAAEPFSLAFSGKHDPVPVSPDFPFGLRHSGTFTSQRPFCASGTAVDLRIESQAGLPSGAVRRYSCADGSGSLTVSLESVVAEHEPPHASTWSVVDGTGAYVGFKGRGGFRGERLSGDPANPASVVFQTSFEGFAAADSVSPTVRISSVRAIKLRRAGAYSLHVAVGLRDDVADNPVSYSITVKSAGTELTRKIGTSSSGAAAATFRVRPHSPRIRVVGVAVTASDPVGNRASLVRTVKLPR
jgi:hypothetical protein